MNAQRFVNYWLIIAVQRTCDHSVCYLSIYQIQYLRAYILHFGEFIDVVYNFCATLTQDRNRRDHLTLSSSEADHKSDCNYIYVEKLRSCKWIFMCDRLESIYNRIVLSNLPKKNHSPARFFRVFSFNFGASMKMKVCEKWRKLAEGKPSAKWQQQQKHNGFCLDYKNWLISCRK